MEKLSQDIYGGWDEYYQHAAVDGAWSQVAEHAISDVQRGFATCQGLHVADLGCGDGRNLYPWIQKGATVVGIDLSPTALGRIGERCRTAQFPSPTLICCDMSQTALASGQFDVVQCYDALPQVAIPENVLREMLRLLKPGGLATFNVFTPRDCAFGEGQQVDDKAFVFQRTLFRFFEKEDIRTILPGQLAIVSEEERSWMDPPHPPFRPQPHRHDGIFYVCRRLG